MEPSRTHRQDSLVKMLLTNYGAWIGNNENFNENVWLYYPFACENPIDWRTEILRIKRWFYSHHSTFLNLRFSEMRKANFESTHSNILIFLNNCNYLHNTNNKTIYIFVDNSTIYLLISLLNYYKFYSSILITSKHINFSIY